MTLKDRLNEAMAATPPENTYRLDALRAALNAGDDPEIAEALARLIEARETKAAAFDRAGQTEQAKVEREEASKLREISQIPESGAAAKPSAVPAGKKSGGIFSRKQILIGGVALAVVAVALAVTIGPWSQSDDTAATTSEKVAVFKDDHVMGNPNAPVTLVEYASFMCPHCAKFALEEFPQLKREFIDTGKLFYIYRQFPLGAPDGAVEGIGRCLPPSRYFHFMEMMYREQPQWDPDGYQIPDVEGAITRLAANEGLSPEKAKQCMTDPAQQQSINQIAQDAQLKYQIEGTPTFVMNGQVVNMPPGTQAIEVLRLRINSLLNPKQQ